MQHHFQQYLLDCVKFIAIKHICKKCSFKIFHNICEEEANRPTDKEFLPSDTSALALHPSDPIQLKCPVAFNRLTAFINSATSWSDPKTITPEKITFSSIKLLMGSSNNL